MKQSKAKRRRRSRENIKAERRRARRRIVIMQRIAVAFLGIVVVGGGGFAIVWNIPAMKLNRELTVAQEYTEDAFYDKAIESYQNALEIDSGSVKAYRCMAGAYLDMKDDANAKQTLIQGWEKTQDQELLNYYCTVVLNEAVEEINNNNCTLDTIQKIVEALKEEADNEDALELMNTAYDRFMQKLSETENTLIFYDEGEDELCGFESYEYIMNTLFEIYRNSNSEQIKDIIAQYAVMDVPKMQISRHHLEDYRKLLEDANSIVQQSSIDSKLACINKDAQILHMFGELFVQFDEGNYEAAKEFIVTDAYTQIRDEFIDGTMEYWNGATYIPIAREHIIFTQTEDGWTFSYPSYKENENTEGVITVWGNKMTDDGIQRSCISYEPSKETAEYYPHKEYVVSYMYSNVQKPNSFEPEMNYHLETRTWTEDGMTTVMIGDWGGPYQWEKTY